MNSRYELAPQLKIYDNIGIEWVPHLMFTQTTNFRSEIVNTDCYGLRFNKKPNLNQSIFDEKITSKKSVFIGGSTAFGVGSSSDQKTISSLLSSSSDCHFYNLGGRAFNGFQELILYQSLIEKLNEIEKIVIFSGLNDLYFFSGIDFDNNFLGPFFFGKQYFDAMDREHLSPLRTLAKLLLGSLVSHRVNWKSITKGELFKYILNPHFRKGFNNTNLNPKKNMMLEDILFRNLSLWSTISRGLGVRVYYFLQPFLGWGKDPSREELEIIKFIDDKTSKFLPHKILNKIQDLDHYYSYQNLLKTYCDKLKIDFFDCNQMLKENSTKTDWLFVDRAHMNDDGNNLLSTYIREKIE
ncbi:hypothetical protein M1N16_00650 [Nitrospinaceae bacterium]|nr:hypothetical protein [Nitrospinaceae bacterium]